MSSNFITLTPPTYTTTTEVALSTLPLTLTVTTQLPTAPGTIADCYRYANHVPIPPIVDQSESNKIVTVEAFRNKCEFLTRRYSVDMADLLEWNPSLSPNGTECEMQPGFSYCVLKSQDSEKWVPEWHSMCLTLDSLLDGDIITGTDPSCDCFAMIEGSEVGTEDQLRCEWLVEDIRLPVANIRKYNDWITDDCDSSLYAGLAPTARRAVCIGAGILGTPTTPRPTSSTMPATQTSTSAIPSSTPTSGPLSTDGSCGNNSPNNATCPGSGFGSCCSTYGWCGDTVDHCGVGNCQSGNCTPETPANGPISTDGSCGPSTTNNATCVGSAFGSCCSNYGYCGSGPVYCGVGNCYSGDCTVSSVPVSTNGKCGPNTSNDATCVGSAFGSCYSTSGWCSDTDAHCGKGNCYSGACQ